VSTYKASAINLKTYNLNEADKIIVMYSKERGIIRAVAKGIKKCSSKLAGKMDLLCANKLLLSEGKNLDTIYQADSIDGFKGLRLDIEKLSYALYMAELVNIFGLENDSNSSAIYDLLFESLKNMSLLDLSSEFKIQNIVWTVIRFQLKLTEELGYALELNKCVNCGSFDLQDKVYFCGESGGIMCDKCKLRKPYLKEIKKETLRMLLLALNFDFPDDTVYKYVKSNADGLTDCSNILKDFLSARAHKQFKTPKLIESLC